MERNKEERIKHKESSIATSDIDKYDTPIKYRIMSQFWNQRQSEDRSRVIQNDK
jgi:hypothetical protein